MTERRVLLDPTAERRPAWRARLPRPQSLAGKVVGLLDISKSRGDVYLDRIESRLLQMGLQVKRYRKPTFARVAPLELLLQIRTECDLLIEALAD